MHQPRAFVETDLAAKEAPCSHDLIRLANRVAVSDHWAMSARESSRDTAELMRARLAAPTAGD